MIVKRQSPSASPARWRSGLAAVGHFGLLMFIHASILMMVILTSVRQRTSTQRSQKIIEIILSTDLSFTFSHSGQVQQTMLLRNHLR
jgi:hypothetical protein